MSATLIGDKLKQLERTHRGSLNQRIVIIMQIMVQTRYDLQYINIQMIRYMNIPTEPSFLAIFHGMKYLMHHLYEPIMHSRRKIFKTNESPLQCIFK